jgi:Holliday junction DNA helicase RuvA
VGKRTAERLAVELRSRLQKRFSNQLDASPFEGVGADGDGGPAINLEGASRDEVHLTLGALGYEALEIQRALRAVAGLGLAESAGTSSSASAEDWIRECLRWLSRDVA